MAIAMSEPGTQLERPTPQSEGVLQMIRGDEHTRQEIAAALPPSVTFSRFESATRTALIQNPDLAKADQASLFQSIVKCASMGLLPDGREAALVTYRTKVKQNGREAWIEKVQCLPMIYGVRKIAGESGWTIHTFVIYANDQFEVDLGGGLPIHRPVPLNAERGEMIGAWAKATHRDGRAPVIEVMRGQDIARSQAVSKTGDKDFSPWKTWTDRMWEKTLGHRIAKKLPLDPADQQRLAHFVEASELPIGQAAAEMYGPEASFAELPSGASSGREGTLGGDQEEAVLDAAHPPVAAEPTIVDEPVFTADLQGGDAVKEQADAAALYIPPIGQFAEDGEHGPKNLGEIFALGDYGVNWLRVMLVKVTAPQEYVDALASFAAGYAPELLVQV